MAMLNNQRVYPGLFEDCLCCALKLRFLYAGFTPVSLQVSQDFRPWELILFIFRSSHVVLLLLLLEKARYKHPIGDGLILKYHPKLILSHGGLSMVFGSATQMAVVPGSDQTPGASESSLHCVEESAGIRPLISNDECGWMELLQVDFYP